MRVLDTSGLACPLPVLKARKALLGMAPGETLEVITTDPMSVVDMPVFCAQAGHRIIRETRRDGDFVFLIERGRDEPAPHVTSACIKRGNPATGSR